MACFMWTESRGGVWKESTSPGVARNGAPPKSEGPQPSMPSGHILRKTFEGMASAPVRAMARFASVGPQLVFVSVLFATSHASADGITFRKGVPLVPHTWVPLTTEQRIQVHQTSEEVFENARVKSVVLSLTFEQRKRLLDRAGKAPRWVAAKSQPFYERECSCGDVNTAMLGEGRIAVFHDFIDEAALGPDEIASISRIFDLPLGARSSSDAKVTDKWCIVPSPGARSESGWSPLVEPDGTRSHVAAVAALPVTQEGHMRAALALLTSLLPTKPFARHLALRKGWKSATFRMRSSLVTDPEAFYYSLINEGAVDPLRVTRSDVEASVTAGAGARWPTGGAMLEEGRAVTFVLPSLTGAIASYPIWVGVRFDEDGRPTAFAALTEGGSSALGLRWSSEGERTHLDALWFYADSGKDGAQAVSVLPCGAAGGH